MSSKTRSQRNSKVNDALAAVLADTFTLALKTQNYHWNVTGPEFIDLHELFGKQYEEMFDAADDIAERMRALRAHAPGGLEAFKSLTTIADAKRGLPAEKMVADLLASHERISERIGEAERIATDSGDTRSADLMVERGQSHDKMAWMLRSFLDR